MKFLHYKNFHTDFVLFLQHKRISLRTLEKRCSINVIDVF